MQIQISEQTFFSISQLRGNLDYLQKKFYNNHHNWFQYLYLWQKYQFITNLNCYIRYFYKKDWIWSQISKFPHSQLFANLRIQWIWNPSFFQREKILRSTSRWNTWRPTSTSVPSASTSSTGASAWRTTWKRCTSATSDLSATNAITFRQKNANSPFTKRPSTNRTYDFFSAIFATKNSQSREI